MIFYLQLENSTNHITIMYIDQYVFLPLLWRYSRPLRTSFNTVATDTSSKTPALLAAGSIFIFPRIMSSSEPELNNRRTNLEFVNKNEFQIVQNNISNLQIFPIDPWWYVTKQMCFATIKGFNTNNLNFLTSLIKAKMNSGHLGKKIRPKIPNPYHIDLKNECTKTNLFIFNLETVVKTLESLINGTLVEMTFFKLANFCWNLLQRFVILLIV